MAGDPQSARVQTQPAEFPQEHEFALRIRQLVYQELPPKVFLRQPKRALIALALIGGIVLADSAIIASPGFAVALPFSILVGWLSASLFFLGHECAHGAIVRDRQLQDLILFPAFLI